MVGTRTALFGRQRPGGILAIEDLAGGAGDRFFVDSATGTDVAGAGDSPDNAYATLDFAVGQAVANNGDRILLVEGHTETLIADSGVDIDVAGLTIIGLGKGADRPTFTFTTDVAADFKLAAAGTHVENLVFIAGIDALTGPVEISAADCSLVNCEGRDDSVGNFETTDFVVLTTACNRCLIDGFKFISDGGAGGTQMQSVINMKSADETEIRNCHIVCDGALGCIEDETASAQVYIHDNALESTNANDVCITLAATSSGEISFNRCKIATDAQATWISSANDCGLFENYGVNVDGETGVLIGTASV